jgi:hypothetical protein
MTYQLKVYGHVDTTTVMEHLFDLENLSLQQLLTELADLNEEKYVYRVVEETK